MKKNGILFAVILSLTILSGCGRVPGIPSSGGGMKGAPLNETQRFTLKTTDGSIISLSQVLTQKKLVLLNFWATWCTYCVEEMPDLVKLQETQQSKGFTVLAVNAGESAAQAAAFAQKHHLNFPVVLDEDMAVSQAYGLVGIPVSFLVNSEGKVIGEYHEFSRELVSDIEKNLV